MSTTFKEIVTQDINNIFFNLDEFAELHNINGRDIPIVIDEDILQTRSQNKSERYDGIYSAQVVIYVKIKDLSERPIYGEHFELDNKLYLVSECSESLGIYEVVLEANDS